MDGWIDRLTESFCNAAFVRNFLQLLNSRCIAVRIQAGQLMPCFVILKYVVCFRNTTLASSHSLLTRNALTCNRQRRDQLYPYLRQSQSAPAPDYLHPWSRKWLLHLPNGRPGFGLAKLGRRRRIFVIFAFASTLKEQGGSERESERKEGRKERS